MKKRLFRIVSYLLILIMMMTNLPMAMAAPAEHRTLQISRENPHFAGLKAPMQITQNAPLYFSGGEEPTFHTNLEAAAQVIRNSMKERQATFTVGYIVDDRLPQDQDAANEWLGKIAFDLLLEAAFAETDDPAEGDSLRLGYYQMEVGADCWNLGNRTKLAITYGTTYFTNANQEAQLTAAVDDLLEEFAFTPQTTEKEKADTIYQWLCDNVDYDHTSPGYLKHSAYAAMVNKKAVCQGYAVLFYRLAEEAGLDARAITGVATQRGELHAWNIARIGDYYYYLDSTWDANEQPQNYAYYLRGENDFYGHTNDARYETEQFRTRYPIAAEGISVLHGTDLEPCSWSFEKNEESHWYQCSVCGKIKEYAVHSGGVATCKEQATCSVCQRAYGEMANHQWTNACDTECDVCQTLRTVIHSFGAYVYNNDATFQKDGTMTRTCSVCQKTETVTAVGTKLENPFKDVQVKEYYAEPVLWAVGKGITNGTAKDTFSPNNECTRGQIVTFLWRAAGSPKPKNPKNPFKDVQKDAYYYDAVLWAVEKGITTGTSANTFSPDSACTRGQVVTFMWRTKDKPSISGGNAFKDVKKGAYYYNAVLWAVKNGITNGTAPGAFSPDATCTRGQIVTFLYRDYN